MLASRRSPLQRPEIFVSAKTATAIPISSECELVRDALVLATLDHHVRSIECFATTHASTSPLTPTIVITRDDGKFVLDVVGFSPPVCTSLAEVPTITVSADDIRREPRYANCRLVWQYRDVRISVGLRIRIIQILDEDGPMPLGRLLASVNSQQDPAAAVMAMACSNLLELDLLSDLIGPRTIVRSRS